MWPHAPTSPVLLGQAHGVVQKLQPTCTPSAASENRTVGDWAARPRARMAGGSAGLKGILKQLVLPKGYLETAPPGQEVGEIELDETAPSLPSWAELLSHGTRRWALISQRWNYFFLRSGSSQCTFS